MNGRCGRGVLGLLYLSMELPDLGVEGSISSKKLLNHLREVS